MISFFYFIFFSQFYIFENILLHIPLKKFLIVFILKKEFLSTEDPNRADGSKMFLRALITSLCRSCLDLNRKKFDINIFLKRFTILKKFVGNDPVHEIEVLKAVQALDHKLKHMPGFIKFFSYQICLIIQII